MSRIGICDFTGCQDIATKKCTCGGRFKLCADHESTHFFTCKSRIVPYDTQEDINSKYSELLNRTMKRNKKEIIAKTQSMIDYIQKCSQILLFNLKKYEKSGKTKIKDNIPEAEIKDFFKNIPKLYDNLKLYSRFEITTSMILSFNNHMGFKDIQEYEGEIAELKEKLSKLGNDSAKGHGGHMKKSSNLEIGDLLGELYENQPRLESTKSCFVGIGDEKGEFVDRRPPVKREESIYKSQIGAESNEISKPTVAKVEIAVRAFKHIVLTEKVLWLNHHFKKLMALQEVEDVRLSKDYKCIFVCNH